MLCLIFLPLLFIPLGAAERSHAVVRQAQTACRTVQVRSGDSCGALASRCGISPSDFTKYNSDPHLCSTLQPDQYVCCSAGSLPDLRPKPNGDGSCATYTAQPGDNCSKIGASRSLTVDNIDSFNKQTWGWEGCINLQAQQTFCISSGSPPMPAPLKGTVCGPQVPGTRKPSDMSKLANLNPCPLNVCCNKWGQCGTTKDFCVKTKSITGAPGTAAPHTNGCISNCGMDIVNNGSPPSKFRSIGYFEAWNHNRKCLTMDASQLDGSRYDTVHFGFAEVTPDYKVKIKDQGQFDTFKKQRGFAKVLSFGGWSFSTSDDSYPIFRHSVTSANRDSFAQSVANFIHDNNLDGVDFDWEYPGAPDIPGIPPGSPEDGPNYLSFLRTLRSKLDRSKSISIAAPASYWYLKGFPISDISKVVDYIVYMTYDLHGQWDYGNKWAAEGCPAGSCLRSHVNYTETVNALAMITKAGVPSNKIIVGVASYGRSFKMTQPGCSGPMCTFTGPNSGARPGECTDTAGYISNAELANIIKSDKSAKTHYDQGSDSVIMQYSGDNWVAYMDDNTRISRTRSYQGKNFGGTVEWAIDLAKFYPAVDIHHGTSPGSFLPTGLTTQSTCSDIETYSNRFNTNGYFMQGFAQPWGYGVTIESCQVTSICVAPSCDNLEGYQTRAGSGAAYLVILSFYNVMNVLETMYAAVQNAKLNWATLQVWWEANFDTDGGTENTLVIQEIFNAIGAAIGIIGALADKPVAAALGALAGGIVSGLNTAISSNTPTDPSISNLADFESAMNTYITSAETALGTVFDGLLVGGSSGSINMVDLLKNGAFVDNRQIPILDPKQLSNVQVDNIFIKHINAAAINWAWHHQRTWLMSYPMTQDEFNSNYAFSGNNDGRLKHYYKGRGYFLMSVYPQAIPLPSIDIPRVQNPPGWGSLDQLGISTAQIIESSADGFAAGGYLYNPTPDVAKLLGASTRNLLTDSVALPGIFNIPICNLDSRYAWTPNLKSFFQSLTGPGARWDNNDNGSQSTICYCFGLDDGHGNKWEDQIDVKNWHGGSYPQCASNFNTIGGKQPIRPPNGFEGRGGGRGLVEDQEVLAQHDEL